MAPVRALGVCLGCERVTDVLAQWAADGFIETTQPRGSIFRDLRHCTAQQKPASVADAKRYLVVGGAAELGGIRGSPTVAPPPL